MLGEKKFLKGEYSNIKDFEAFVRDNKQQFINDPSKISIACNDYIKNNITHYKIIKLKFSKAKAIETMYEDFDYLLSVAKSIIYKGE